jgi:hypothetical protein
LLPSAAVWVTETVMSTLGSCSSEPSGRKKVEGELWLLYSVWIQLSERTALARRTSSTVPSKLLALASTRSLPTLVSEPVRPS